MYSSIEWIGRCHGCGRSASVNDGEMLARSRVATARATRCERCGAHIELNVSIARLARAGFSKN
ncbi:MAG: hypothetical protein ACYDDQ_06405 [Vulcanimicrobiaceae bacterium]